MVSLLCSELVVIHCSQPALATELIVMISASRCSVQCALILIYCSHAGMIVLCTELLCTLMIVIHSSQLCWIGYDAVCIELNVIYCSHMIVHCTVAVQWIEYDICLLQCGELVMMQCAVNCSWHATHMQSLQIVQHSRCAVNWSWYIIHSMNFICRHDCALHSCCPVNLL